MARIKLHRSYTGIDDMQFDRKCLSNNGVIHLRLIIKNGVPWLDYQLKNVGKLMDTKSKLRNKSYVMRFPSEYS